MPRRKCLLLEIMEMERLEARLFDLRVVMIVVVDGNWNVFMALKAMLDVLASEFEQRIRTLHESLGPGAQPTPGSLPWR